MEVGEEEVELVGSPLVRASDEQRWNFSGMNGGEASPPHEKWERVLCSHREK